MYNSIQNANYTGKQLFVRFVQIVYLYICTHNQISFIYFPVIREENDYHLHPPKQTKVQYDVMLWFLVVFLQVNLKRH